jgi:hypothetical protein
METIMGAASCRVETFYCAVYKHWGYKIPGTRLSDRGYLHEEDARHSGYWRYMDTLAAEGDMRRA